MEKRVCLIVVFLAHPFISTLLIEHAVGNTGQKPLTAVVLACLRVLAANLRLLH